MELSDQHWRDTLTPEQYAVLREKRTEAPFSGEYETNDQEGLYACAACGRELFDSKTKFDAHCGWPSFYDAKPGAVTFITDDTLGMSRTEAVCSNCQGHLGHVFEGEGFGTPTDTRFCVNSLSLKFTPRSKP